MKRIFIIGILVVFLAVSVQPAAAITGGELDGEDHPNVGLMIADIDGVPAWRCSGTLIAPRVFLTAGHCTGDGATGARVWFESDLTNNVDYPYPGPSAIEGTPIPHPLFATVATNYYDVGVVILDQPAAGILPALLPEPGLLSQLKKERILEGGHAQGAYFKSVGFGGTLTSWPPPVIDYDRIRRWSESEFASLTQNNLHLFQRAVFDESGSCFGDLGGPLFWTDTTGKEIVVAVTSTGDAQCVATGFNYRVDVPEILEWIYSQFPPEQ